MTAIPDQRKEEFLMESSSVQMHSVRNRRIQMASISCIHGGSEYTGQYKQSNSQLLRMLFQKKISIQS